MWNEAITPVRPRNSYKMVERAARTLNLNETFYFARARERYLARRVLYRDIGCMQTMRICLRSARADKTPKVV